MSEFPKLAVEDMDVGLSLILDRVYEAPEEELDGLALALKCLLPCGDREIDALLADAVVARHEQQLKPVTNEPQEAVKLLLDLSAGATDAQVPGLVAALEALLEWGGTPGEMLVQQRRDAHTTSD